jgi:nucleotide-binding universal stress UspA family protein
VQWGQRRPTHTLTATVKDLETDAIVVGAHGSSIFEGLLGSTGTKSARCSPCPVLMMRTE